MINTANEKCIYCDKYMYVPKHGQDADIVTIKQSGRYGTKTYAHTVCFREKMQRIREGRK